jgi:carbon starvation protein CstA
MYLPLSLAALFLGYHFYGRFADKVLRPDKNRRTPALTMADEVDYAPMSKKDLFMNQFLSISGAGPVFGPLMGILYGPTALLWIVIGAIFAGAVHDYLSGMISIRYRGDSWPDAAGRIYGKWFKLFMRLFSFGLLILVGVVMATAPANLLSGMTRFENDYNFWLIIIFAYYFLATIAPIDILINRFNPFFTSLLAAMAVLITIAILVGDRPLFQMLQHPGPHPEGLPLWPLMCVTIACGAISGFHATQSTITSRCLTNETMGRQVFYGSMILEGVIALLWATAGMTMYNSAVDLQAVLKNGGPAAVIMDISNNLLGEIGGFVAILGVVILPVTSGDTAFRAARLLVADVIRLPQKKILSRVFIALPIFALGIYLSQADFPVIWRYFAWFNQSLACLVLWAGAAYLVRLKTWHWLATLPATFMTAVVSTFILYEKIGLGLSYNLSVGLGLGLSALLLIVFLANRGRLRANVPYAINPAGEAEEEPAAAAV